MKCISSPTPKKAAFQILLCVYRNVLYSKLGSIVHAHWCSFVQGGIWASDVGSDPGRQSAINRGLSRPGA